MSHQPINSFGLLMHAAPLFCVTALLFFLFGIGLASFVFNAYAEQEIKAEKEHNQRYITALQTRIAELENNPTKIEVTMPNDTICQTSRSFTSGAIGAITALVLFAQKRRK